MQLRYTHYALPLLLATQAFAADQIPTHVPAANPRAAGQAAPNILSPELIETPVAQGSMKLENPADVFRFYGYNDNGPMVPTARRLRSCSVSVSNRSPNIRRPVNRSS